MKFLEVGNWKSLFSLLFIFKVETKGCYAVFRIEDEKLVCAISRLFMFLCTEPPSRANRLFGNAQSGSERTSFSGSTVTGLLAESI